ncbi:uncharacterized protein LOC114527806 [Dendronephthya gigantea]|uniref:uncharacterized protein LOC114527806 n=1 Tax=Dendronephthya gigantea TaxID=151771 RepID=UPI00106D1607|nr:uncharacterized protein LOC114527806 [Dendronephthya gigantea]
MERDAQEYEDLAKPQYISGCNFVNEVNIFPGARVLDMGCGTGSVTKHIGDIAGSEGQTVGVDPDAARIKIAEEKYKEQGNLQFHVGNSVDGFPHDNEPYYDFHVSTNAFHWFPDEHKRLYIQKAYQSLKPGGKLSILCRRHAGPVYAEEFERCNYHAMTQDEYEKLFQDVGLFSNVIVKQADYVTHFKSYEAFKRWFKASAQRDLDDVDPVIAKEVIIDRLTFHDDGGVDNKLIRVSITARK